MYCESSCPVCCKRAKFWVLVRNKQETGENAPKVSDIFMEPDPPLSVAYEKNIDDMSPDFSEIYRQACIAEQNGSGNLYQYLLTEIPIVSV